MESITFFEGLSPAEIAQLVEHNLAKVRVASSSLVFRSKYNAGMFMHLLVDTHS